MVTAMERVQTTLLKNIIIFYIGPKAFIKRHVLKQELTVAYGFIVNVFLSLYNPTNILILICFV